MEELKFEDYIKPTIGQQKEASAIITSVFKQISNGRFEIVHNNCKVEILLNGAKRTVILSDTISLQEFRDQKGWAVSGEASLDFLYNKIGTNNEPLLKFFKNYQDQFYKLGTEFQNEYWYKIYSKTEIQDEERELHQARWINYEEQLKKGKTIYDESGIYGLWAMPENMLVEFFKERCKEHYGNQLFVLKLVPECRYVNNGKEIIGDRFEVVEKYDLTAIEDIGKLFHHLLHLKNEQYETKISELNEKIKALERENVKATDNQTYLSEEIAGYDRKKRCYSRYKWLYFFVGIVLGIILCKFM